MTEELLYDTSDISGSLITNGTWEYKVKLLKFQIQLSFDLTLRCRFQVPKISQLISELHY